VVHARTPARDCASNSRPRLMQHPAWMHFSPRAYRGMDAFDSGAPTRRGGAREERLRQFPLSTSPTPPSLYSTTGLSHLTTPQPWRHSGELALARLGRSSRLRVACLVPGRIPHGPGLQWPEPSIAATRWTRDEPAPWRRAPPRSWLGIAELGRKRAEESRRVEREIREERENVVYGIVSD
jgi:hypothetical protein